ncbi:hypothetical protein [Streptosporangium sp. CA-115845]|uniref:hypothetical protein n=1 Tax=Streptosporangium sp. CA-115845 TaxID=3240071 RepID=UPI003D94D913
MVLGVMQWVLLGLGCLNTALGIYALLTKRVPGWAFRRREAPEPYRYGWGQLLVSLFAFVAALQPMTMDWPFELSITLLMLGFGAFLAGLWLMHSGKRARRIS